MDNILVVLDGSDNDNLAMQQAVKLIAQSQGKLHILMTEYDQIEEMHKYIGFDNFKDIKQALLDDAETQLRLLADRHSMHFSSSMAWGKRWNRSAVDTANKMKADLIIKVAGDKHSRIAQMFQTPEDWNLLRDASCPVWLINADGQRINKVIATISTLDESAEHWALGKRVILRAQGLSAALAVPMQLVSVIPDFRAMALATAYVPPMPGQAILWHDNADQARVDAQKKLDLALDELKVEADTYVFVGSVEKELSDRVESGALLVIGSAANRGLKGKFIGNTAEKVLHYLTADMVVVH